MVDKLRLEVLLAAVDKVSGPLKAIARGSRDTAQAIGQTSAELKKLESQQRKLKRLQDAMPAMGRERNAMRVQQAKLDALRSSGAGAKQIAQQEFALQRQTATYERQRAVVLRLRSELTAMGVGSASAAQDKLTASIKAANAQLDAQRVKMERQQRIEQRMAALTEAHSKTMHRLGMAGAAAAGGMYAGRRIVQAGLSPVGAFMAHEDAMLGIARQVPGARDSAGNLTQVYRDAEAQVRELSTRLPQTTVQIADMMTAAARMEVPTDQLGMFVELASEMGTAFDAVPGEIAESMGKIAKNLKIPVTEIRGMADTINYLDDNAISKGADIIGALNRVSGITGTVGITGQNMAALVSTLLTSGETEETTGTGIKAIFTNLAAATRMPKRFQRGIGAIGMSGEQIQTGMAKDAVGTLLKLAEAIKKLPASEQIGVMADIAGKEHVGRLAKLVSNTEEFRRQLALANGEEAKGSMAREAAARNAALSARLQMARNQLFNAAAGAGELLKQSIIDLIQVIAPMVSAVSAWVKENPALAGGILKTVVALGALITAASAIGLGIVTVLGPLAIARFMLSRWLLTLVGARMAATAAAPAMGLLYRVGFALGRAFVWLKGAGALLLTGLRVLAAFLIANPIVLALGLLATAGYMLYSRWADVVGGFKLLMQDIGAAVSGAAQYVWGLGARFFDAGAAIMQGMYNGITSRLGAVRDAIGSAANGAIDWFKQKLGINSPSRVFMQLGAYVGEGAALGIQQGAGLVRGAAIGMAGAAMLPMAAMANPGAAAGPGQAMAGSTYQITINAAPGMDPQAIARAVSNELDRRERAQASRRYSRLDDID